MTQSTNYQTERHLAEELALERKARQQRKAYNASQHVALAIKEMVGLPLDSWGVEAHKMLVMAHSNLCEIIKALEPEQKGKPKGRGRIIDVEVCPDPFSIALTELSKGDSDLFFGENGDT